MQEFSKASRDFNKVIRIGFNNSDIERIVSRSSVFSGDNRLEGFEVDLGMTICESNGTPELKIDLQNRRAQSMEGILIQTLSPKCITQVFKKFSFLLMPEKND